MTEAPKPKPRRVGRLNTAADIRREMGLVYRQMRRGELVADVGTKLFYALKCMLATIEVESIDRRLSQLEELSASRPGAASAYLARTMQ